MKKIASTIMAITLFLGLSACGDSSDSTTNQGQTAVAPTEESSEQEMARPSLDSVTGEVLHYVENENMIATDEIIPIIEEKYNEGNNDPYSIFTFLCDNEFISAAPIVQNGIIVLTSSFGPGFTTNLDIIDPDTGVVQHLRTFSGNGAHRCSPGQNGLGTAHVSKPQLLAHFNSDLTQMTASLTLDDGSIHVGWINESGVFTDISQMVTADTSDFAALTKHSNPCFGPDNYFYFRDSTNSAIQIKRVPINNLTVAAVETLVDNDDWPGIAICPLPNGKIENSGSYTWYYFDAEMAYPARGSYFNDWISSSECVGVESISNTTETIYRYSLSGNKSIFDWVNERTELLPRIKGRTNWNPIVSPDTSKVAFLSKLTTGTDTTPYLYIVPSDGGEPVKVPTDYTFEDGAYVHTYLLTWSGEEEGA